MITGIVRQRDGKWYVDHCYPLYSEPKLVTLSWLVTGARRTGPFAPEIADGLTVDSVRDRDAWQAYSQGDYVVLETEHHGEASEADFPCPKVRGGLETRYRYGIWEKCTKAHGWVRA